MISVDSHRPAHDLPTALVIGGGQRFDLPTAPVANPARLTQTDGLYALPDEKQHYQDVS